jgi:hypothetical protein
MQRRGLAQQSVTVPGPECDRLAAIASAARVVLVVGIDEREQHAGTVYNTDEWILDGYSVIVDPTGTVIAGPLIRERGILTADLDLDALLPRRRWPDATGHYAPRRLPPARRRPTQARRRNLPRHPSARREERRRRRHNGAQRGAKRGSDLTGTAQRALRRRRT